MNGFTKLADIKWPRGLYVRGDDAFILCRGRPRGAGGAAPDVDDEAGYLYRVSLKTGDKHLVCAPTNPPFRLLKTDRKSRLDIETDRPHAGLAWHPASANFFICCYSGIDKPSAHVSFRKNATDAILRHDTRSGLWHEVDRHDSSVVDAAGLRAQADLSSLGNQWYPSSDSTPRGWSNGPDGLWVDGDALLVVGKDNHSLVSYDLRPLIDDDNPGHLQGTPIRMNSKDVKIKGTVRRFFDGPSAVVGDAQFLYVGSRTTSKVLRFKRGGAFDEAHLVAELPTTPNVQLIDMVLDPDGALFVSSKRHLIWRIEAPTSDATVQATEDNAYARLPGTLSNLAVDEEGRLLVCSNDGGGAIYREDPPNVV